MVIRGCPDYVCFHVLYIFIPCFRFHFYCVSGFFSNVLSIAISVLVYYFF